MAISRKILPPLFLLLSRYGFDMRKIIFFALVALIIGVGIAFWPKHSGQKMAPSAQMRPALTVTITSPQHVEWPLQLKANGTLQAWQEATVSAQIGGVRIAEVLADVGDNVKKDQELARFDPQIMQAQLNQQKAAVDRARAALGKADADAQRANKLKGTGSMSAQDLASYVTAAQTARADVKLEEAKLAAQNLNVGYTSIIAPDDGIISSRTATIGAVVQNGAELFRLIRQGRIEWRAELSERLLADIKPEMNVRVQIAPGQSIDGTVRLVAPTVDQNTRNALVYVDLPEPGAAKPGMFAEGEFLVGNHEALIVPEECVVVRDGYSYVFRLKQDNHVDQVRVETARRQDGMIELHGTVKADDRLVQQGAGFLSDGDLVAVSANDKTGEEK